MISSVVEVVEICSEADSIAFNSDVVDCSTAGVEKACSEAVAFSEVEDVSAKVVVTEIISSAAEEEMFSVRTVSELVENPVVKTVVTMSEVVVTSFDSVELEVIDSVKLALATLEDWLAEGELGLDEKTTPDPTENTSLVVAEVGEVIELDVNAEVDSRTIDGVVEGLNELLDTEGLMESVAFEQTTAKSSSSN